MADTSAPTHPGWQCVECGFVWGEAAVPGQHYGINAEGEVRCILKTYCRQRRLRRTLNLAGPDGGRVFYGQVPTDRLRHLADPRPANWRELKWRPIGTEMQRVDAWLTLHTVCYPVCMPYACKINAAGDDVVYKRSNIRGVITTTLDPEEALERDIAADLNMHQPNVSRALKGLVARHLWRRDEDGRTWIVAQPAALTIEERWALTEEGEPEDGYRVTGDLRELPREYRLQADALLKQTRGMDEDIRSDIRRRLLEPTRVFREAAAPLRQAISDLRSTRNSGTEKALSDCTILISQRREILSSSSPEPDGVIQGTTKTPPNEIGTALAAGDTIRAGSSTAAIPETAAESGPGENPVAAAYGAGMGQGALAKLPPPDERAVFFQLSAAIQPYTGAVPDERYMREFLAACRKAAEAVTLQEIIDAIHEKGHLAVGLKSPAKYLQTTVVRCFEGVGLLLRRQPRSQMTTPADADSVKRQEERLQRQIELDAAAERKWIELPLDVQVERLARARHELESEPRFRRLSVAAQRAEVEQRAKAVLARDLANERDGGA